MKTESLKSKALKAAWRLYREGKETVWSDACIRGWVEAKGEAMGEPDFSMEAMSVCTAPVRVKTGQEKYLAMIYGRAAQMAKRKVA